MNKLAIYRWYVIYIRDLRTWNNAIFGRFEHATKRNKKNLDFFMAMAGNDTIDFVPFSIITTPTRMRTPNKHNHSRCLTSSTLEFIRLDVHFFSSNHLWNAIKWSNYRSYIDRKIIQTIPIGVWAIKWQIYGELIALNIHFVLQPVIDWINTLSNGIDCISFSII